MNTFIKFLLLIAVLILFKIINKYLASSINKIKDKFKEERLMYGLTSRYLLSQLTAKEFEEFCSYYLVKNNYANINTISEAYDGGLSLTCSDSSFNKIYVSCIKSDAKENNRDDAYSSIGRPTLQKFVGAMAHDKIRNGIVITNRDFTKDAIEYINNLPKSYNIKLVGGVNLSKSCWELRKRNLLDLSLADLLSQ